MDGRVLIADADISDCRLMQQVMSEGGLSAVIVHDGQEAAPLVKNEKFSLLIVDLLAPSISGLELTKSARVAGPNQMTPIVVISGDQDSSAVGRAFDAGANFFLYKPIDRGRLLSLLRATQGNLEHERRRFRRVSLQLNVRLRYERREFAGETINVSLNGLLARCDADIPTGSHVAATIYLPSDDTPIECGGTIMRALGANRIGILLDHVNADDNLRMQDFLLPLIHEGVAEHILKA